VCGVSTTQTTNQETVTSHGSHSPARYAVSRLSAGLQPGISPSELIVITSSHSGIDRTTVCGRTGKQSH
jgi:hypothetical protein